MDCPRCGHRLTTISVAGGDGEATYCERCRFADVTSEFEPAPEAEETWDEAIDRFRRAAVRRADDVATDPAGDERERDGRGESTDGDGHGAEDDDRDLNDADDTQREESGRDVGREDEDDERTE